MSNHYSPLPVLNTLWLGLAVLTGLLDPVPAAGYFLAEVPVITSGQASESMSDDLSMTFVGPEGQALHFADETAVVDFLASAEIVHREEIPEGINRPVKLLLERDGVQMNAILRTVDRRQRQYRTAGRLIIRFQDSYLFEPAAYRLSRLLGLDTIPPAIVRRIGKGRTGSLQVWLEGAQTDRSRRRDDLHSPHRVRWFRQWQTMRLFDALIDNFDRNQGNILLDSEWKMWWIDHSRAFTIHRKIQDPRKLYVCERGLWDSLRRLDRRTVEEEIGDLLNQVQIKALMARRDLLVNQIQAMIDQKGEDRVLFDLGKEASAGQEELMLHNATFDDIPDHSTVEE